MITLVAYVLNQNDFQIGRSLSGISICDLSFGMPPPRFKDSSKIRFNELFSDFEQFPERFKEVIPHFIANVVFHLNEIVKDLRSDHPFFLSKFWLGTYRHTLVDEVIGPTIARTMQ